ncbi:hypothetical protein JCM5353_000531, partial [Sporobolomyces roseus]
HSVPPSPLRRSPRRKPSETDARGRARHRGQKAFMAKCKLYLERKTLEANHWPTVYQISIWIEEALKDCDCEDEVLDAGQLALLRGVVSIVRGQVVSRIRRDLPAIIGLTSNAKHNRDAVKYLNDDKERRFIWKSCSVKDIRRKRSPPLRGAYENEAFRSLVSNALLNGHSGSRSLEEITPQAIAGVATMLEGLPDSDSEADESDSDSDSDSSSSSSSSASSSDSDGESEDEVAASLRSPSAGLPTPPARFSLRPDTPRFGHLATDSNTVTSGPRNSGSPRYTAAQKGKDSVSSLSDPESVDSSDEASSAADEEEDDEEDENALY